MSELAGMTVNERLVHKGLLDEFDRALERVDLPALRRILSGVELDEQNVRDVIRSKFPFLSDAVINAT